MIFIEINLTSQSDAVVDMREGLFGRAKAETERKRNKVKELVEGDYI